ncbi:unnamed protein product [Cyprideis torosa]|uniref:Transmembrane protein 181 n=1 Tax=Cyprideis torosa TaxID=163714 RepID=A0A7R8ZJ50_9CRUS|nr:unnamed protein product [Cyprideis torosa]CAG0881490.1 unnamed protein product [Cyprideis torosa]
MSQVSDLFSQFSKHISPAYNHDRCERSVPMRLYSMQKREFALVVLAFLAVYFLLIVIGLSGPPITEIEHQVGTLLDNKDNPKSLSKGPFYIRTNQLSSYHQQLWLIGKMQVKDRDGETFQKNFQVEVSITGVTAANVPLSLLDSSSMHNRTRTLQCVGKNCQEINLAHLGFIEFSHYIFVVKFFCIEEYALSQVLFFFKSYNPAFTQMEIWFRLIFLLITGAAFVAASGSLRRFHWRDWSMEQKWILILLFLLFLFNDPQFPLVLLWKSPFPGILDGLFQSSFLCSLLMFWLCVYHGLRQNNRSFKSFYLPKLILVGSLWLSAFTLAVWERSNELRDPTYSYEVDVHHYQGFKTYFYISCVACVLALVYFVIRAYSELQSMPYFDLRLNFVTFFMVIILLATISMTVLRFGVGILEDHFVSDLNTTYASSSEFMCFYGLFNLYVYTMAYVYLPGDVSPAQLANIMKDNPTISMMNDSDEEILFGDECRKPLNSRVSDGDDSD